MKGLRSKCFHAAGLLSLMLAGCGSGAAPSATQIASEGRLPRKHEVSAADMELGEGTDFCDRFPQPVAEPFRAEVGSRVYVLESEPMLGSADALVTLIAYNDLTSPESADFVATLRALAESKPDGVRVIYRHLPGENPKSPLAGEAAEAAHAQHGNEGFWAMLDVLTERYGEWAGVSRSSFRTMLSGYAEEIGLDVAQFDADLDDQRFTARVEYSAASAAQIGVNRAPALFANELLIENPPLTLDEANLVVQVLTLRATYAEPPPMVIDPAKDYVAWIVTEHGVVAADLFADLAPETVNNFAYLACSGYYDNITFHRVVPDFVAQAGDPTGLGFGGPGYTIPDEFEGSALLFDRPGWLSMAHTRQPDSAGAQFFITLGPAENLNGSFTIFGEVVEGMEVAQRIAPRDPQQAGPLNPGDSLETVIVRELP